MRKIVVCGNGPSLADVDLKAISGAATLGMNAAYRYWEKIDWYPDIYCCLDDRVVVSHQDQILGLIHDQKCKIFFLHHNILVKYPGLAANENCIFLPSFDVQYASTAQLRGDLGLPLLDAKMFWSKDVLKVTTGAFSVRFAAALGFTEILLLGVDARYVALVDGAMQESGIGLTMASTPTSNPNYFFADYQQKGDLYNLPTPPTHDGNLHSDVFKSIKDDFQNYAPEINIYIGSKKSTLYMEGLYEYRDLETFTIEGGTPHQPDLAELVDRRGPAIPRTPVRNQVFSGWFFTNGVRRANPEVVEWAAGSDSKSIVNILLGNRFGFKKGSTVNLRAKIQPDQECRLTISAGRHGSGPYEAKSKPVTLGAGKRTDVEIGMTLENDQSTLKFSFAPVGKVGPKGLRLSITDIVAT